MVLQFYLRDFLYEEMLTAGLDPWSGKNKNMFWFLKMLLRVESFFPAFARWWGLSSSFRAFYFIPIITNVDVLFYTNTSIMDELERQRCRLSLSTTTKKEAREEIKAFCESTVQQCETFRTCLPIPWRTARFFLLRLANDTIFVYHKKGSLRENVWKWKKILAALFFIVLSRLPIRVALFSVFLVCLYLSLSLTKDDILFLFFLLSLYSLFHPPKTFSWLFSSSFFSYLIFLAVQITRHWLWKKEKKNKSWQLAGTRDLFSLLARGSVPCCACVQQSSFSNRNFLLDNVKNVGWHFS